VVGSADTQSTTTTPQQTTTSRILWTHGHLRFLLLLLVPLPEDEGTLEREEPKDPEAVKPHQRIEE